MIKIAQIDAYPGMDEIDFKVMDQELELLWNTKDEKEMTYQFFANEENIFIKVYWDGEEVRTIAFTNKVGLSEVGKQALAEQNKEKLTEEGKNTVGRPSLGTTKKVSLTLPDEIWEMIEKRKEKWEVSQSATLRMMIESYWSNEDAVSITSIDAAKMYDKLENYFYDKYGEETENEIFTMGVRALYSIIFGKEVE